jgi:transcription initiation factor TFIID subunit 1
LEAIDPTCSREKNARMKKQTQHQLEKLKKMTERRRQRQLSKTAALAENPVLGLMRGKREGAMVSIKDKKKKKTLILKVYVLSLL